MLIFPHSFSLAICLSLCALECVWSWYLNSSVEMMCKNAWLLQKLVIRWRRLETKFLAKYVSVQLFHRISIKHLATACYQFSGHRFAYSFCVNTFHSRCVIIIGRDSIINTRWIYQTKQKIEKNEKKSMPLHFYHHIQRSKTTTTMKKKRATKKATKKKSRCSKAEIMWKD